MGREIGIPRARHRHLGRHQQRGIFAASDQRIIETVAAAEYARSLSEFNANNAASLRKLREEASIKILKYEDCVLKAFLAISRHRSRLWRRAFQENLCELPAVPRVDHGLEQHFRTILPGQPRPRLIDDIGLAHLDVRNGTLRLFAAVKRYDQSCR
jgi:hypothetical protein